MAVERSKGWVRRVRNLDAGALASWCVTIGLSRMDPSSAVMERPSPDLNSLLLRQRNKPAVKLRVGLVVPAVRAAEWVARTIQLLRSSPVAEVEAVYFDSRAEAATPGSALFELHEKWSRKKAAPDRLTDISQLLAGVEQSVIGEERSEALSPEDRSRIRERGLDVLLWLGKPPGQGDASGLARFGVWSFGFGEAGERCREPHYYWEAYSRQPVSTLVLWLHKGCFEKGRVLYRYTAPAEEGWFFTRNGVEPLGMAAFVAERSLWDLAEYGFSYLTKLPSFEEGCFDMATPGAGPSNWEAARYLGRQVGRSVRLRVEARGRRRQWFVAARFARQPPGTRLERFQPEGFEDVPAPAGRQYADPFLMEWRGRRFLFVEDIPGGASRGRISALEVLGKARYSEPTVVLERPYHLSYPCVFSHADEFFMIPETAENRTVDLYRATDFPWKWTLEKTFIEGVALVDTTPFYENGVWYFFTTTAGGGCDTYLFWSERLSGEWQYHPKNPICSDVRRARGAGHLFYRQGRLIRPSQDGSVRYGYAIALNEVLRISTTEYEERPCEVIRPTWRTGLFGTHTLNADSSVEVIDGNRYEL